MTDPAKQPPVYFSALELENVRCFGACQALSLTDDDGNPVQWTLIFGDNGVGKTTLLQCLAWMRPDPSMDENTGFDFLEPALSSEENSTLNSLARIGTDVRTTLKATFTIGRNLQSREVDVTEKDVTTSIVWHSKEGRLQHAQTVVPTQYGTSGLQHVFSSDLAIFAYGATRRSGTLKRDRGDLSDPIASIFWNSTELYDAEDTLLKLDYRAAKSATAQDKRRLIRVKQILAAVLPDVGHEENIRILGPDVLGSPSEPSGVWYETPYGAVPQSALSLGYQTTLTWIADLALRLYERYPESLDPLSEPGIVLIDEIELHLHPRWQRRMMEDLSKCFPAVQFIATAHSPLVAQAVAGGNLAVLRETEGQVSVGMHSESVTAWRADQILASNLFGIPSRSKEIEMLVEDRNVLLANESRGPDDEARLNLLEERLESLRTAEDPEGQADRDLIRRVAASLRDGGMNQS